MENNTDKQVKEGKKETKEQNNSVKAEDESMNQRFLEIRMIRKMRTMTAPTLLKANTANTNPVGQNENGE